MQNKEDCDALRDVAGNRDALKRLETEVERQKGQRGKEAGEWKIKEHQLQQTVHQLQAAVEALSSSLEEQEQRSVLHITAAQQERDILRMELHNSEKQLHQAHDDITVQHATEECRVQSRLEAASARFQMFQQEAELRMSISERAAENRAVALQDRCRSLEALVSTNIRLCLPLTVMLHTCLVLDSGVNCRAVLCPLSSVLCPLSSVLCPVLSCALPISSRSLINSGFVTCSPSSKVDRLHIQCGKDRDTAAKALSDRMHIEQVDPRSPCQSRARVHCSFSIPVA